MDKNNIYTVIITALTVFGGTSAWRFYEKRASRKEKDEEFIRHDCRDRIAKLEALLLDSTKEKDELRKLILELTKEVAELRVKVEYVNDENEKLEKSLGIKRKQQNGQ
jgi:septal ring factor EnvC (AmiA/AmiB activator)